MPPERSITALTGDEPECTLVTVPGIEPDTVHEVENVMGKDLTLDADTAVRQARYGNLPERIRFEDMTEEVEAAPGGAANVSYDPAGGWKYYSCLALDLGL